MATVQELFAAQQLKKRNLLVYMAVLAICVAGLIVGILCFVTGVARENGAQFIVGLIFTALTFMAVVWSATMLVFYAIRYEKLTSLEE